MGWRSARWSKWNAGRTYEGSDLTIGSADERAILARAAVEPQPVHSFEKVGIDDGARRGGLPLNGLRHPPSGGTSGWYIWSGAEPGEHEDFFKPLHAGHLVRDCPSVLPYLALPPGWRFLISKDYEDIWFDKSLLEVE
jgi:hypothetical protein